MDEIYLTDGTIALLSLFLGFIAPFFITLVKRYISIDNKLLNQAITYTVCLVVIAAVELYRADFVWEIFALNSTAIFGATQFTYQRVIKPLKIDEVVEN